MKIIITITGKGDAVMIEREVRGHPKTEHEMRDASIIVGAIDAAIKFTAEHAERFELLEGPDTEGLAAQAEAMKRRTGF